MSASGFTEYVCDRCGAKRTIPDKTGRDWPDDWSRMMVTTPPLASPLDGIVIANWHLCHACTVIVTRKIEEEQ